MGTVLPLLPSIPGKSDKDATRIHEEMAVDLIKVKPGQKILDAGCGVGGPMRAIAAHSKAHVTGITINDYQVKRAKLHNKKRAWTIYATSFAVILQMPFDDNSFDGAYSIEATCHAPKLEEVYAEIYRVMKPGSLYVSYEWVTTDKYRDDDEEHREVIQGIERETLFPMGRVAYWRNHVVVVVLSAVGIAPKGTVDVHEMLFKTADYLSRGGETVSYFDF
ncbi:hypothetical protein Bca52824_084570 [Brassica carinata]|uniref:Methyltransferase n=1 Tax=Brassica carinata TaxID=52824 RepID=A0A8X7PL62_BRACI|nr:hypothetical protein Bca52824_084570 [Brassica carinata]